MPTHVVLGATGGVGSATLRALLDSDIKDLSINVLVRSKQRLLASIPGFADGSINGIPVNIYVGSTSDQEAVTACVRDTDVIYHCIGANAPSKVTTTAQVAAKAVIKGLESSSATGRKPAIVFNRSLALNKDVRMPIPGAMLKLFEWLLSDIYADLTAAVALYNKASQNGLLSLIIVDAPGLFDPTGTERTGHKIMTKGKSTTGINYADVGGAFVEIGIRRDEFRGQALGIAATGKVRESWKANVKTAASGFRYRLLPF